MSAREKQATPKAAFVFLALINEQTFAKQIESTIVRVCEFRLSKVEATPKAAFVFLALINEQTFAEQIESTIVRVCESKLRKV